VLIGEPRDARARATAHTELASAYYERGNLGVALDEAKVATQADPSYAPAQNVLGLVYMELKEPTEAQASFERALRIDPQDSDANHNMGWFLCQSGREQDSIKYFLAAIQNPLYKTPAKSYAAAAGCYQKVGHADNALDYYGRALRLDPNFVPALLPYARLQMARGGLDDARAAVTRYNALASPSAESLGLLLQIERRRGDSQAEQSVAAMLGKRFPDSKEYRSFKRGELQ
jgi:type IV pilus assembly protein PilF